MKKIFLFSLLLIFTQFQSVFAQRNICGTVTDQRSEEVLIGVKVMVKGTLIGTVTDIEGKYCVEIPAELDMDELVFTYIGFESKTVKVADSNIMNVTLYENAVELRDLMIVGYRSPERSEESTPKKRVKSSTLSVPPPPPPPAPPAAIPVYSSSSSFGSTSEKSVKKLSPTSSMRTKDVSDFKESPMPKGDRVFDEMSLGMSEDSYMTMPSGDYDDAWESSSYEPEARAGLLTAGEINDFSKWTMWQDLAELELKRYQRDWRFFTQNRYTVQVSTKAGKPLVDATVRLLTSKKAIHWEAKTDNTGKAELWLRMFGEPTIDSEKLKVEVEYEGKTEVLKKPNRFQDGINFMTMEANCNMPKRTDILFVVDATSSMGDEINYLKAELKDVITQVQTQRMDLDINLGSVFYRDEGDEYLTKKSDFSTRIDETVQFIQNNRAAGGGDYEEAVEEALRVGIEEMKWSKDAVARLLFLVLDAPPHANNEVKDKLNKLSQKAAAKGIRIVPITASGINKSTEYLMRSLALATNGTYTFLTDHSGVGGSHLAPSTDDYDMEFLNDLLVRLIDQFTQTPECGEDTQLAEAAKTEPIADEALEILNFYPNPVVNELTIELKVGLKELFIADLSGKILQRLEKLQEGKVAVDMSPYPSGIYLVRYTTIEGKEGSAKVVK